MTVFHDLWHAYFDAWAWLGRIQGALIGASALGLAVLSLAEIVRGRDRGNRFDREVRHTINGKREP